jgi:hypothetical protein
MPFNGVDTGDGVEPYPFSRHVIPVSTNTGMTEKAVVKQCFAEVEMRSVARFLWHSRFIDLKRGTAALFLHMLVGRCRSDYRDVLTHFLCAISIPYCSEVAGEYATEFDISVYWEILCSAEADEKGAVPRRYFAISRLGQTL